MRSGGLLRSTVGQVLLSLVLLCVNNLGKFAVELGDLLLVFEGDRVGSLLH